MNKFSFRFTFQTFALVGLFFAFSLAVNAQFPRTWVSAATGDDINSCDRDHPCKTFTKAITVTNSGGEINCLDPGGYGTLTITKSITIDCEDTQGSILASGTNGIVLTGSGLDVRLRGLSIHGVGTGSNCIRIVSTGTTRLTLDEIVCAGFTSHGISVETNSGSTRIVVWNSSFRNNVGNGINTFLTGSASATIAVDSSLFANNSIGINLGLAATGSVVDSTITNNTTGVQASGSTSVLALTSNQITHNSIGILAGSSATIRIGGNIITANGTGLMGANIFTFGSNFVDGNTTNGLNNGPAAVQ